MHQDAHVFLDRLRTRSPFELAEIGECEEDEVARHIMCAAATRGLIPSACHSVLTLYTKVKAPLFPEGIGGSYWTWMNETLKQLPARSASLYDEAQNAERNGDIGGALALYSTASDFHPLAAASVARLGGRPERLAGWRRYVGARSETTVALQCLAIMMDKLRLGRSEEARTRPLGWCVFRRR